jgi:molybdopterin converting factor small subunit
MPAIDRVSKMEILLFAVASELAQADSITVEANLPITASDLMKQIGKSCPPLVPWLASCRLAVDQVFVTGDHVIDRVVEVALIPPVSGG